MSDSLKRTHAAILDHNRKFEADAAVRQRTEFVWLTNGIGEISHATPNLLADLGLESGLWQGLWYPLTQQEQDWLMKREAGFWMPSGFMARLAYSAVHAGRKWFVADVEYTDEDAATDDDVRRVLLAVGQAEARNTQRFVDAVGGRVVFNEDELDDGHVAHIGFPAAWAMEKFETAVDMADWLRERVGGKPW